jgi:hypothetical protein
LFSTSLTPTIGHGLLGRNQYDVTPRGDRFLVRELQPSALTVVVNWPQLVTQ